MSFSVGAHVITLELLEDLLYADRAMATTTLIAATLFFYDHLLTLSAEIDLVWHARWNVGKVLFLLVRYMMWPELGVILYYDFIGTASDNCRVTYTYSFYSLLVGITVADVILVLRTWAIWDTKRSILILLFALLSVITTVNFYIIAHTLHNALIYGSTAVDPARASIARKYHGCFVSGDLRWLGVLWSTIAGFELVVFGLTAVRGIVHFRGQNSTLVSSLYRDGMMYFGCLFALSATNVVLVYTNFRYALLLGLMQCTFHSILCCRLVLHLRAVALERQAVSSLSTIAA